MSEVAVWKKFNEETYPQLGSILDQALNRIFEADENFVLGEPWDGGVHLGGAKKKKLLPFMKSAMINTVTLKCRMCEALISHSHFSDPNRHDCPMDDEFFKMSSTVYRKKEAEVTKIPSS